jgi:SOS-response transcriptional repressor LexA
MLTSKQARVLELIEAGIAETGGAPTYREIAAMLGSNSISNIYNIVKALEARGFVERIGVEHGHRQIKVIRPQTHLNPEYLRGYQDGYEAGKAKT